MDALQNTGLQEDCPFSQEEGAEHLTPESAREVPDEQFMAYAGRLNAYLQVRAFFECRSQVVKILTSWLLLSHVRADVVCSLCKHRQLRLHALFIKKG